jgi:hypothetical protein
MNTQENLYCHNCGGPVASDYVLADRSGEEYCCNCLITVDDYEYVKRPSWHAKHGYVLFCRRRGTKTWRYCNLKRPRYLFIAGRLN